MTGEWQLPEGEPTDDPSPDSDDTVELDPERELNFVLRKRNQEP